MSAPTGTAPTLPEVASALIAVFEGCRLTAYRDSGGILTIGYGHTGPDVHEGMTITQAQADALFAADQAPLFKLVAGRPILEAAALVSFGYNCGAGTLNHVLTGYTIGTSDGMPAILAYCHDSKGSVLPGLQSRRALENMLIRISQNP